MSGRRNARGSIPRQLLKKFMKKLIFILLLFSYCICSAQTYDLNAKVAVTTATNNGGKAMTLTELKSIVNNWSLTGNAGTTAGANFIGTTDNVPLVFKQANTVSGIINNSLNSVSLGYASIPLSSTGSSNSALGHGALNSNTSGYNNSAIGSYALLSNTIGINNIAIGSTTLQSSVYLSNQTAIGYQALAADTSGSQNTAIGFQALFRNLSGSSNTGIGYQAGYFITTGGANTVIGNNVSPSLTSGYYNTLIGVNAGASLTTGSYNTYIGVSVIGVANEAIGSKMLAIGNSTGTYIFGDALANIGIGTTVPSYRLDVASDPRIGNPIRVQGLQPGSTSDSIVSSNNGVLRRLAISDIVTGTTIPYVYSNSAGATILTDATTTTVVWGLITDIVGNNALSSTTTTGTFDTYVCQKTGVVRLSGAFDITPGTTTTAISNLDVFATTYLSDGTTIVDSKLIGGYTIPNGSTATARISGTFSGSSYTTVGQKIKIRVFQNTGGNINLASGSTCSLMVTQ